jgi:PAS domain S-box-containing protein
LRGRDDLLPRRLPHRMVCPPSMLTLSSRILSTACPTTIRGKGMDRTDFHGAKFPGDADRGAAESEQASRPSVEEATWLHSVIKHTSDVVSISGPDGTIRYVSPSIERVLGYRPEEMVGESGLDYVHSDEVVRMIDILAEARDEPGVRPTVEVRCRHKDGSWRWLEVSGKSMLGDPEVRGTVSRGGAQRE